MPFDPTKPVNGVLVDANFLRGQFNALKDISDALAANTITSAVVDSVTTLNPGEPATVTLSVIGTVLHMSFAFPRGADGLQGLQGTPGAQGPPFANAVIDNVNTLNPMTRSHWPMATGRTLDALLALRSARVSGEHFVFNIPPVGVNTGRLPHLERTASLCLHPSSVY